MRAWYFCNTSWIVFSTDFNNFWCFGKLRGSVFWFSGFVVFSTSALLSFKSICAKKLDLLVWLEGPEVDFPTSDDFYFFTIRKRSVRRVFMAIKRRWGVPAHPSTNHDLKRSWAKNQILDQSNFACLTIGHGGGLPDLGWFLFFHHLKEECQARFYSYQAPVGGTGTPLIDPWIEEVASKNLESKLSHNFQLYFLLMVSSIHGSMRGVPVPPTGVW